MSVHTRVLAIATILVGGLGGGSAGAKQGQGAPVVVTVEGAARMVDRAGVAAALAVGTRLPRGARVTTGGGGFVGVRLGDGVALAIEPDSDVVVWGDRGGEPADHHFVRRGALRVVVERGAGAVVVATRAALARFGRDGEPAAGVVEARDLEATVAAHDGVVDVEGRGATVTLTRGLSTRVDRGDPPRRPRALAAPPSWRVAPVRLVLTESGEAAITGELEPGGGARARRRVEVARDEAFLERVAVRELDGDSTRLTLAAGSYHLRLIAPEGGPAAALPSAATRVEIVTLPLVQVDPARARVAPPRGLRCALLGAPTVGARDALLVDRRVANRVRCAAGAPGPDEAIAELALPPLDLPVTVTPKLEYADEARGYGRISVLLSDVTGAPAKGRSLAVSPSSDDIEVREIAELDYPGLYVVRVRWKPGRRELPLSIAVGGSRTTVEVALPIPRG
jgi:hypothetical protein